MFKQFVAAGGLSAECVQVSISCKPGASRELIGSEAPKALEDPNVIN